MGVTGRCDTFSLSVMGSLPEEDILCGWVVNSYSEESMGQSYGRAEEVGSRHERVGQDWWDWALRYLTPTSAQVSVRILGGSSLRCKKYRMMMAACR